MTIINKKQAFRYSRYNFQFFYDRAGITYEDFLQRLPHFDIKKAAITKSEHDKSIIGEFTLIKKLVLRSFIEHFWSIIPNRNKKRDLLLKASFSNDGANNLLQSSNDIYYYPPKITKSAGFVLAPVSNPRYNWQCDLDHILLDSHRTEESRHLIHIIGEGNDGKTSYIKHKLMNSKIFGFFSPLSTDEVAAAIMGGRIRGSRKSYYLADISRVVEETNNLFKIAEELGEGMLTGFEGTVVVFSNDHPPMHLLSKDRWEIYRINYNNEGASNLQQISKEDCADLQDMGLKTLKANGI